MKITIANKINVFHGFSRKILAPHFVQGVAQDRSQILPCWLRMRNFSVNSDLSGGDFLPPFFASTPALTNKVSGHAATRASESIHPHASKSFYFDHDLIFEAAGLRQNGAMKCFDTDGETGRWSSATSVWLKASVTTKIKASIKVIWKLSHKKSCAINAQCDLKILITLLRMVNVSAHKYKPDARKRFAGHCGRKPQNAFCFIMKLLPVCLRVGFQFDGRINYRNAS